MADNFYQLSPEQQGKLMQQFAAEAIQSWGMQIDCLQLIKMRENVVFKLHATAGDDFALRIHRYDYHSDASLRSEIQWTQALSAAAVSVPRIKPTLAGEPFAVVSSRHLPEPRQVDLYAWIDGRQLGSIEAGLNDAGQPEEVFHTVGKLAAQLHNQATTWTLPEGFSRHAWDVDGLLGDQPFWGRFWELQALTTAQRDILLRARQRLADELTAYGKPAASYSLIHADLTPENIMVAGDEVKIIDFDDAGFGWHQFDIATALFFFQGERFFNAAQTALVKGYRTERALTDESLSMLPLFFLARSFTYLAWVHSRYETETAQQLTPELVDIACALASNFLET